MDPPSPLPGTRKKSGVSLLFFFRVPLAWLFGCLGCSVRSPETCKTIRNWSFGFVGRLCVGSLVGWLFVLIGWLVGFLTDWLFVGYFVCGRLVVFCLLAG